MKNFVQRGDAIDITAAAAVLSGGVVLAGAMIGVSSTDAEIGETFALNVTGVYELPKVAALAIAVGDIVYWDSATKLGVATTAAPNPSRYVNVRLSGAF
jgi:predicted RecA/RadA family phage recombinase